MTDIVLSINRAVFQAVLGVSGALEFALSPGWRLALISFISGFALAFLYERVVDKKRLLAVKQQAAARMIETVLFRREPGLTLKAQAGFLWCCARWLAIGFIPAVIVCVPGIFLFTSLNSAFGSASILESHGGILSLSVADKEDLFDIEALSSPAIEASRPVRVPERKLVQQKIVLADAGPQAPGLHLKVKGIITDISPLISGRSAPVQTGNFLEAFVSGAHYPAPDRLEKIDFNPGQTVRYSLCGISLSWFWWSLIFLFAGAVPAIILSRGAGLSGKAALR